MSVLECAPAGGVFAATAPEVFFGPVEATLPLGLADGSGDADGCALASAAEGSADGCVVGAADGVPVGTVAVLAIGCAGGGFGMNTITATAMPKHPANTIAAMAHSGVPRFFSCSGRGASSGDAIATAGAAPVCMAGCMLIAPPPTPEAPGAGMFENGEGGAIGAGTIGAGAVIPNGSAATFAMPAGGGVGAGAGTAGGGVGGVGEKSTAGATGSSRRSAVASRPAEIGTTLFRPAPGPAPNGEAGAWGAWDAAT